MTETDGVQITAPAGDRYDEILTDEALGLLEAAVPGRAARIADLTLGGYPAYSTAPGWLGYSDEQMAALHCYVQRFGDGSRPGGGRWKQITTSEKHAKLSPAFLITALQFRSLPPADPRRWNRWPSCHRDRSEK